MTTVQTGTLPVSGIGTTDQGYGLGWTVNRDALGSIILPFTSIGTFFHVGAFSTAGWVDPKKDLVGIFLVQRFPFGTEERDAFMSIVASAVD
jgi:CubicO group peptidase (beta-lactamase class C family)